MEKCSRAVCAVSCFQVTSNTPDGGADPKATEASGSSEHSGNAAQPSSLRCTCQAAQGAALLHWHLWVPAWVTHFSLQGRKLLVTPAQRPEPETEPEVWILYSDCETQTAALVGVCGIRDFTPNCPR